MSRWNSKIRNQNVAVPLETLILDKEKSNIPSVSAVSGKVGKWGVTSFTSIRSSAYGGNNIMSYSPLQETSNCSPKSPEINPIICPVIKPRKFFKSRNVESTTNILSSPPSISQHQEEYKQVIRINRKLPKTEKVKIVKKTVLKIAKPEPIKKTIVKEIIEDLNKRSSGRSRNKVNYNEDLMETEKVRTEQKDLPIVQTRIEEEIPIQMELEPEPEQEMELEPVLELETTKQPDHPPIVLRISKGTSRLISTDSEDPNTPTQENVNFISELTSTSELLAVLSDSPPTIDTNLIVEPEHERITIKIKTDKIKSPTKKTIKKKETKIEVSLPPPVVNRATRASKRQQQQPEAPMNLSPQPGSENYDLYKTLASPTPSEKDFDSQSSILGSVSSVITTVGLPEDSQVIHSRGSSDITSDLDTSQSSIVPDESNELAQTSTEIFTLKKFSRKMKDLEKSPPLTKIGRVTRNNNNNGVVVETKIESPVIRSYTRKRKIVKEVIEEESQEEEEIKPQISNVVPITLENSEPNVNEIEYKIKNKFSKSWYNHDENSHDKTDLRTRVEQQLDDKNLSDHEDDEQKPSVKLVLKKKGSIFKSRALVPDSDGGSKKRHVYKHKWDDDTKDKTISVENPSNSKSTNDSYYEEDFDNEGESSQLKRTVKNKIVPDEEEDDDITSVKCAKKVKRFYTVVRNVKKAHQIQEIGEFQEMDDDVEYILDALQPHNPLSTRCLSAIQLAQKCMTPAFRMHVRAHGTVTKFFKALNDANKDQSLGLCTATIMFVLSQDTLNMDLDRDSLELMLNLLESDVSHKNALDDCGLTKQQLQRNKQKVRELCEEIKKLGKAQHLNLDNIAVGTLAMETLLSLTSKRAGEWFKEELRQLGGLEHIIKTICECCRQISDYVVDWTDALLEKLRKIERCLRVLENVTQMNEQNQEYILHYNNGDAVNTLVKLYKLCDSEIALYPTTDQTEKDYPGVAIREALVPTLKVLINLTHSFNEASIGCVILGGKPGLIDTSLHLLLQAPNYVPDRCIFELSILVLLLLINLTIHTIPNRTLIMKANAPSDFGNQFVKMPAIKALVQYFYKCDEMARLAEQNTDAILDQNPTTKTDKKQSQEDVEETVNNLLQKAGHHMEHTMLASYDCLLIGQLIIKSSENEKQIRQLLHNCSFEDMIKVLDKYYNFMNLTASAEASIVAHIKSTKNIIELLQKCESHSNE